MPDHSYPLLHRDHRGHLHAFHQRLDTQDIQIATYPDQDQYSCVLSVLTLHSGPYANDHAEG